MAFEPDPFRPVSRTRRSFLAVLAVAMAAFVTYSMTRHSGEVRHAAQHPADVAACQPGQQDGCVGSMTAVIAVPALPAAASVPGPRPVP